MVSNPTLAWQRLHDVYYTHKPVYDGFNSSIGNLVGDYIVKVSTNGTLIAITSKASKFPNLIDVYSLSGNKLWTLVYNSMPDDHIVDFVFRGEDLCVILNKSRLRYYSDFKGSFNEYNYTDDVVTLHDTAETDSTSINPTIEDLPSNVIQTLVCGRHLVMRLRSKFVIVDLNTFVNYELHEKLVDMDSVHQFQIVAKNAEEFTILACYKSTVVSFVINTNYDSYEFVDHVLTDGPFTSVAVSPNGQLVCLYNELASCIHIVNRLFDRILLEYSTDPVLNKPYQIEWCANDAIVLSLKDEIKLIGPGQHSISFFYDVDDDVDFTTELRPVEAMGGISFVVPLLKTTSDGIFAISSRGTSFYTKVSEDSRRLFEIGSSDPSSILMDCVDKMQTNPAKADTNISLLKTDGTLERAMDSCLNVAMNEFNHYWQKKALKAVSFGKAYLDGYDAEKYIHVLNLIKVLNQIRAPEVGLFFTYDQLVLIGWERFLEMLVKRDLHLLALRIVDLLGISHFKSIIYVDWCSQKIRKELSLSDSALFQIVARKLEGLRSASSRSHKQIPQVTSIDSIFETAYEEGRVNLCKMLINLEPTTEKKISQFLKFKEYELALFKAFQSGNDDIAALLLMYLQDSLPTSKFFRLLSQNEAKLRDTSIEDAGSPKDTLLPVTGELISEFWVHTLGKNSPKVLETFYKQEDNIHELNISRLSAFLSKNKDTQTDTYYLDYKSRLLKSINSATNPRYARLFERELDVLELQKKLGDVFREDFYLEKSLTDVIIKLVKLNQFKTCTQVVKDFKLSDVQYWNIALSAFMSTKDFDGLFKFVSGHRHNTRGKPEDVASPIGFRSIIDECLKHNAPKEHVSFYIKCNTDARYTERVDDYLRIDDVALAASEAARFRDVSVLRGLLGQTDDETLRESIKRYIERLG